MKIKVRLEVSQTQSTETYDLDDLGITQERWDYMTNEERRDAIQRMVHDMPEQPYWVVDRFDIED